MMKDAVISACGKYRYSLKRIWDTSLSQALFIMLNPSTADYTNDDATIRSCIRLARAHHFGGFEVVNLFAYRSRWPRQLLQVDDPIGPRNLEISCDAIDRTNVVICAWGAFPLAKTQVESWLLRIESRKKTPMCFDLNKNGSPRHPLYVKTRGILQTYDGF